MKKSSKPIIDHIPHFLNHCKRVGLSIHTQTNYKRYLNKFIFWLKEKSKESLLPHELTANDIWAYRLYLSRYTDKKGRPLKKVIQNYYLIALRAFLGYFIAKDIVSLPPDKIALPKDAKREKTVKFLNLEQIERLLLAPNIKKPAGLRNRAILETLISTGLRVKQLTSLNRDQLNDIPREALPSIKEYLKTREDENKALFINYKSRKSADKRLTVRSVERIVNKYGGEINLPFLITPEILRWARAHTLLNAEIKIRKLHTHKTFLTNNYKCKTNINSDEKTINHSPIWYITENAIKKEVLWLKNNIPVLPEKYKANPPFLKCDDCILRKVAILIVGGNVKATEFQAKESKNLWSNFIKGQNFKKVSKHGQEWHRKMMDIISNYFKTKKCAVVFEPILNYGRADLGIYSNSNSPLFIEVGTVSLFKLWYNLSTMKNVTFLIVPSEECVIEFKT